MCRLHIEGHDTEFLVRRSASESAPEKPVEAVIASISRPQLNGEIWRIRRAGSVSATPVLEFHRADAICSNSTRPLGDAGANVRDKRFHTGSRLRAAAHEAMVACRTEARFSIWRYWTARMATGSWNAALDPNARAAIDPTDRRL